MFKHLHHIFKSNFHKKFNLNQLDFFSKLLASNVNLKNKVTTEELQYFIDLIVLHGKYPEFLEIFKVFIAKNNKQEADMDLENHKKIINVLFDDGNIEHIHVNFFF